MPGYAKHKAAVQSSPYTQLEPIDLVGLTLDAQVHDVVPADGAVVHHDVPGPQGHRVPLLHLESLLLLCSHGRTSSGHLIVTVHIHF